MYLSRFRVKNYKCLADVDIPLTPIHVLIGPNDAGKTSLLEAIAAFYGSIDKDFRQLFPEPWEGCELVFHGARDRRIEFAGECMAHENAIQYTLSFEFALEGRARSSLAESMSLGGQRVDFPSTVGAGEQTTHLNTYKRMARAGRKFGAGADTYVPDALVATLRALDVYAFKPRVMAVPAPIDTKRKFRLRRDGFGLATVLMDILGHDRRAFDSLENAFCRLFPQFRSVQVPTEDVAADWPDEALASPLSVGSSHTEYPSLPTIGPRVGAAVNFEGASGDRVRAQQASDGAILMLGFLALAHLPEPPSLVLIEEPENGIYPKTLGEVIRLLREMVKRPEGRLFPQIIMTTHSPYVLSFFEPEEVTFLSRDPQKPEAGVRARPLREAPNIRERLAGGEFYLGELWYNLTEEELFGEPAEQGGPGGLRRGED